MPPNAKAATARPARPGWPGRCPGWPRSRARARRTHGRSGPVRHRQEVPLLHRPGPQGIGDRRDRPQGPAHVQGRILAAAHHPGPRRRHRPQARPPACLHLLPADDRARQRPPRRAVRRRQPGRAGLDRHAPRYPHVVCDTDGRPVTPAQAKAIIAERWTVPPKSAPGGAARRRGRPPAKSPEGNAHGSLPQHPTPPRHNRPVKPSS